MEEDSSTPLFTVGQETAAFLASCEILFNAWEESGRANNSESFSLKEHGGVTYVAFPSFLRIESFIDGEGTIETNNQVFSDCLKGDDDKPAQVHQGALKLFLDIMEKSDFQAKIDQLQASTDSRQRKLKPIIFVGHSLGGAVATLATLWFLEKRIRQISSFCITFGCPLVGDERLVEAVGRENWGGNFCHVVSKHDIVPRMLLAPIEAISAPLTAILPYWDGKVPDSSLQDACRILLNLVTRNGTLSPVSGRNLHRNATQLETPSATAVFVSTGKKQFPAKRNRFFSPFPDRLELGLNRKKKLLYF